MTQNDAGDRLRETADSFIRERFDAIRILNVEIIDDPDTERDEILSIRVTFDGTPRELAQNEPPGFLSTLWERLAEFQENVFPVVSFRPAAL